MIKVWGKRPAQRIMSFVRAGVTGLGVLSLASCMGSTMGSYPGADLSNTAGPTQEGEVLGTGSVRVGLLLPMSGSNGSIASVFKNSAELALANFPNADVQLLVKDTGGTAQGGQAAANAAIAEGAEMILGPVFAPAVTGAASAARSSGIPLVAFSSDASVAARGVYLLSFLPESDVRRVVEFASSKGKTSFAALLPNDSYGSVVEAAFRQEVGRNGGRIVSIQRYSLEGNNTSDLQAKAQALAGAMSQADALFIPAGGGVAPLAIQTMVKQGVNLGTVKVLGSGQWDSSDMKSNPIMAGSWYPGPVNTGYTAFAKRYQDAYGQQPPRNATLAYDGVTLAAGLVRSAGAQRFSQTVMTNPDGFIGIDGLFRFRQNGQNERGLAIFQITGSGVQIIDPAPRTFKSGT